MVQGNRPFDLTGERNEKVHSEQRKLVATAYSMSSMVHFESKVNVVIETLIHKLEARCGKTIDLGHWLQMWAFGVFTHLLVPLRTYPSHGRTSENQQGHY